MKRLCVFCGSKPGNRPIYIDTARRLGLEMARRGIALVYGGAKIGVMGAVADAVLQAGGRAVGVIPEHLIDVEVAHAGLTELHVTASMHERKTTMAELADGFVALPGGLGTYEEFFEVVTWLQLKLHAKPCGLLNVAGFYDPLLGFLDHAVGEGFIKARHRQMILTHDDPAAMLDLLADHAGAAGMTRDAVERT